MSKEIQVYTAVCITLVDGKPTSAVVNPGEAPWPYCGCGDDAFDLDTEEWFQPTDDDRERAEGYVVDALRRARGNR